MEDSPTGYVSSQQVPLVSWDMESPNTTTISPRSITLPWPENCGEASPATRIADWQISHRNKRRIRRVPHQTNVFKRYGLLTDTPEKSTVSPVAAAAQADHNEADDEFDDDLDDETIAQIRLTPMLKQQQGIKRPAGGGTEGITKSGQVFKTPTNFKSQGRTRKLTGEKVLPRKLTAEFDCCAKQQPATSAASSTSTASSSKISPTLSRPQGNSLSQQMIMTKLRAQEQQLDDDEAMMSGDDEMVQQAVQCYLASQVAPTEAAVAPAAGTQEEENKENSRTDDYIDSDDAMLDDLMSDDFVMQVKVPPQPHPNTLRTPPQIKSPEERKRARLSLSLTKKPRI